MSQAAKNAVSLLASWAPKAFADGSMRRFRCTFIGRGPGERFAGFRVQIIEAMSADEARHICMSTFDVQAALRVTELGPDDLGYIEGITAATRAARILCAQDGPFTPDQDPPRGPNDCPWCGRPPEWAMPGSTLHSMPDEFGDPTPPICVDCRRDYRDYIREQAREPEYRDGGGDVPFGDQDGPHTQSMEHYTTYGRGSDN